MPLTDEQLRSALVAGSVDVDVDGDLARVRARTTVHRRRRRTVMALVSLVAVVAIAVVASFAVRDDDPARRSVVAEPAPTVPTTPISPPTSAPPATTLVPPDVEQLPASAVTDFTLPSGVGSALAIGGGSVWIGGSTTTVPCHARCGSVTRIDPDSGSVVATITVDKLPRSLAYGFGLLWMEAEFPDNTPAIVVAIDPATNQIVAQSDIPGTSIAGGTGHPRIAVGAGAVWVQMGTQLTELDPASGAVVNQAQIHSWGNGGVVANEAGVWVVGSGAGVVAIDPGTLQAHPLASLPGGFIQSSTLDGDSIWLTEAHNAPQGGGDPVTELIEVDTTTGEATYTGLPTYNVAAGDGRVWFQGFAAPMAADTRSGYAVEVDPANGRMLRAAMIDLATISQPFLAVDGSDVWVLHDTQLIRVRS